MLRHNKLVKQKEFRNYEKHEIERMHVEMKSNGQLKKYKSLLDLNMRLLTLFLITINEESIPVPGRSLWGDFCKKGFDCCFPSNP